MKEKGSVLRVVALSDAEISYTLTVKKVKNINLRIGRDKVVRVSANRYIPIDEIDKFVIKNASFIRKALQSFEETENRGSKNRAFINGEIVTLFGKEFVLQIIPDGSNHCYISGEKILIHTETNATKEIKSRLFYRFIDMLLMETVLKISDEYLPKLQKHKVKTPIYKIRDMRSRYGSCKKSTGNITINRQIISAPISAITYLVCHELSHLVIANHSANYYSVLAYLYPDYKSGRDTLRQYGTGLL